jgi:hypothetical protein
MAVDLGPLDFNNVNDALDPDTGPNNLQNTPGLTSATRSAANNTTTIAGTLNSQANRTYRIEIETFVGQDITKARVLGSFIVTTNSSGVANFTQVLGATEEGAGVAAFATDLTTNDSGEYGPSIAVNTAPMIINDTLTPQIDEGGYATLSGQLVDPDRRDHLTLRVNWGDGSPVQDYHPGRRRFSFDHQYLDDGVYDVQFTWIDEHGAFNTRTHQVVVHEVAPQLRGVHFGPDAPRTGQQVVLVGRVDAPSTDYLTLTIDWGDGTTETLDGWDLRHFRFKHRYPSTGDFTIQLTVTDDDGSSDSMTFALTVR